MAYNTQTNYYSRQQPTVNQPASPAKSKQQPIPQYKGPLGNGQTPVQIAQANASANQPPAQGSLFGQPSQGFDQIPSSSNRVQHGNQSYNPTTAPFGMDQSLPGVAEQNWENNQNLWYDQPQIDWVNDQLPQFESPMFGETFNENNIGSFGQPGQGEQFWNQIAGTFNSEGQYGDPNLAAESYHRTVGEIPGSLQPSFDAAFDRASEKSVGAANNQAASRGVYGSSSALNNVGNVITDIEAQRANRASDFALQDSANQRDWQGLAGQQGRAADLSSMGAFGANLHGLGQFSDMAFRAGNADLARDQFTSGVARGIQDDQMNRLGGGFGAAFGSDASNLNRTNSGFNASMGAQDQRDGRIQGALDNTGRFQDDIVNYYTSQLESMFGGDENAMHNAIASSLGMTMDDYNANVRNQERVMRDVETGVNAVTGAKQAGVI